MGRQRCSQRAQSGEEAKLEGGGSDNTAAVLGTSQHFCVLPAFAPFLPFPPAVSVSSFPVSQAWSFYSALLSAGPRWAQSMVIFFWSVGSTLASNILRNTVSLWLSRVNVLCFCEVIDVVTL